MSFDFLEPVEIEAQKREAPASFFSGGNLGIKAADETRPVGQTAQRIEMREVVDAPLICFLLGQIAYRIDAPRRCVCPRA